MSRNVTFSKPVNINFCSYMYFKDSVCMTTIVGSNRMDFRLKNCLFIHCCARMVQIYIDNRAHKSTKCNMAIIAL